MARHDRQESRGCRHKAGWQAGIGGLDREEFFVLTVARYFFQSFADPQTEGSATASVGDLLSAPIEDRWIVVLQADAPGGDYDAALDVVADLVDELMIDLDLVGEGIPDGVGYIDHRGTGLDGGADDVAQEVGIGPGRVHGAELHVRTVAAGLGDHGPGQREHLVASLAELVGHLNVARVDEDV